MLYKKLQIQNALYGKKVYCLLIDYDTDKTTLYCPFINCIWLGLLFINY